MGTAASVSSLSVGEFTGAVASDAPVPGGGGVAATVAALAAGLASMVGRFAVRSDSDRADFRSLVKRTEQLRSRALLLADDDAAAYGRYVEAIRLSREPDPDARARAIRAALDASADVPYRLASIATEVADAGEQLAVSGNPNLRSDACIATLLGAAVAGACAVLVAEDLRRRPGDPRVTDSARAAAAAGAAAERVLAFFHDTNEDE